MSGFTQALEMIKVHLIYLKSWTQTPPAKRPVNIDPSGPPSVWGHFFNVRLIFYPIVLRERAEIRMQKQSHQPKDGYVLEVDGKFELKFGTIMGALKAGLELKMKYPHSQVEMHDELEQAPADE